MSHTELLDAVTHQLEVTRTARKLYQDRLAPDFNIFEFFRFDSEREAGLSRFLGWLLDPKGSHGQGGRFLHAFVDYTGQAWTSAVCDTLTYHPEHHYRDPDGGRPRRPDLVYKGQDHILLIENKEWAGEQEGQIQAYLGMLDKHQDGRADVSRRLVYLTPSGRKPTTAGSDYETRVEKGEIVLLRYQAFSEESDQSFPILEWLKKCRALCASDRIGSVLKEFESHISKRFDGVVDMSEQNAVLATILERPDHVASALEIAKTLNKLKKKLIEQLLEQVRQMAVQKGWEFRGKLSAEKDQGFYLDFPGIDACAFCCAFDANEYAGFHYGIWAQDDREANNLLREKLKELGTPHHAKDGWLWMRNASPSDSMLCVEKDWNVHSQPWKEIRSEELISNIKKSADLFYKALRDALGPRPDSA